MLTRRGALLGLSLGTLALGGLMGAALAADTVPAGYPADYGTLIEKARAEGAVSIYTSTDLAQAQPLLDTFKAAYPGITIEFNDLGTNGAYNRVISEAAANQMGADLIWTSAMDLQMVLVRNGYTVAYHSPEAGNLPDWGNFKDQLYATTVEPAAILYNKTLFAPDRVPKTRADLIALLKSDQKALTGKVATLDPEKSGTGFLYATNDVVQTNDFWDLVRAFGGADGKVYSSSGAIREKTVSGEHALVFNVIGSYALDWARKNPTLGVAFPTDYTSAFSRVASITKGAPHPNAARLFLDFMLSKAGQTALGQEGIPSIRKDVDSGLNLRTLNDQVGGSLRPIKVDEHLAQFMDQKKRIEFYQSWKKALRG